MWLYYTVYAQINTDCVMINNINVFFLPINVLLMLAKLRFASCYIKQIIYYFIHCYALLYYTLSDNSSVSPCTMFTLIN